MNNNGIYSSKSEEIQDGLLFVSGKAQFLKSAKKRKLDPKCRMPFSVCTPRKDLVLAEPSVPVK